MKGPTVGASPGAIPQSGGVLKPGTLLARAPLAVAVAVAATLVITAVWAWIMPSLQPGAPAGDVASGWFEERAELIFERTSDERFEQRSRRHQ